ncbi:MAG: DUF1080 domain-containing protein [Draconibacterium sp.]|nr:DUF1080 domain-containing protein [Draconibacterium sp.]
MRIIITVFLMFFIFGIQAQTVTKYSPKDLESWQSLGDGKGYVTHGQFMMEEVDGSIGFMIFSPEKYNDVILRYEVMTMNPATVLVALLNASDKGNSTDLIITDDNKGSFGHWTKEAEDYMFGFRVMAHNSTPFLRKHPAPEGGKSGIGLAEKNVMQSGWRHTVEIGKKGSRLWLKIDGETLIDVTDNKPLDAGKISLRVRGTAGILGKSMIRNLEIIGEPVK